MEFFVHFTQQITEYYASTVNPISPNKALLRGTALVINLLPYSIFINVPILFPGIFIFILTSDEKILPVYSLFGIALLILILITEIITIWRIWGIFSKDEPVSQSQSEDELQYQISTSLLFLAIGLIPLVHVIFCPLAVIYAVEGVEIIDRKKFNPKYRLTAKSFIIFGVIIYVVYSTIILFTILLLGNAGAIGR